MAKVVVDRRSDNDKKRRSAPNKAEIKYPQAGAKKTRRDKRKHLKRFLIVDI